ncbi:hypothetical protein [Rhizobium sp. P007]|uniref:hypothetical protein n=1 Tax=Rhizobium sp. P007 TaxID=285908 RepID=UPI00163C54B2|nr:hypothetical protein [Rhizobium sp. P007]CAD7041148.1 hypothetical protein RP007_00714 [Rhizobium sp. P007]
MRYAVIKKTEDGDQIVYEDNNMPQCFHWITKELERFPTIPKEDFRVADREFDQGNK